MIRPFTCVCLILAAGSGLYLYQVKQRAFALDASLRSTFHDIDVARERTRMLRADWALVNDPERLQALASQYLTLQPMQPAQLQTMDQLATDLPPPVPLNAAPVPVPAALVPAAPASSAKLPAAPVIDPTRGAPMAFRGPQVLPHTLPAPPEVALLRPVLPTPSLSAPSVASENAAPMPPPPVAAAAVSASTLPPAVTVSTPPHAAQAEMGGSPRTVPPRHPVRHPVSQSGSWVAEANGFQPAPHRRAVHRATPAPSRQFYAANDTSREADAAPRITPPAATVMYRPVASGSSLGMASSASMAPPRPLYSTSQ